MTSDVEAAPATEEQALLSERLRPDVDAPAWVIEEIKALEERYEAKNTQLTHARVKIYNLEEELDEVGACPVVEDSDLELGQMIDLVSDLLRAQQANGTLCDVGRDTLHHMRLRGYIRW